MGRRRVLVLAPAIARMQCMNNPYKRVKGGAAAAQGEECKEPQRGGGEGGEAGAVRRRGSFWSSWRKRKAAKRGGSRGTARRRWGFRVSKLRIRMLSPGYWLKKLRDSYINMMLALERTAPMDCSGMVAYPSLTAHPHYPGAPMAHQQYAGAWVWPTLAPPVVF